MKVAICEFTQESDSFNPVVTGLDFFQRGRIAEGQAFYDEAAGTQTAVGGMLDVLGKEDLEPVLLFSMRTASSGGPVGDDVINMFMEKTLKMLSEALPVDGLLVSLHGATLSESCDDVCGYILESLRKLVGPSVPVAASFDLHANITAKMQANADFICGYQTYPHVDFFSTGSRAARLLAGTLKGRIHARTYRITLPLIAPAGSYNTLRGRFSEIIKAGHDMVQQGRILDFTVFQAQPWLDVKEIGANIIAVGGDEKEARACAAEIAKMLLDMREDFRQKLYSIDEVIRKAEANRSGKPVVLCDASDSVGAGACGDSAALFERIKALDSDVVAALYVKDRPAVAKLWDREIGSVQHVKIGSSMCTTFSDPVEADVQIISKHKGEFATDLPLLPGAMHSCGRVVTVKWRNVSIVLCENIVRTGSLELYRAFGVEPLYCQLVNVKACTSFRRIYEPVALEICETDTPGAASAVLERLPFKKLPTDRFFPFSDISGFEIPEAAALR
ncbi:MAG: M81 family metallopeptidase [Spirochaetales bacterium]|nr:M81 family metallopeptidase [Spirochaetales bacterium]